MYTLEIHDFALSDLKNITEYLFEESFSRDVSDKEYDLIMASVLTLKIFPLAFPQFEGNFRVMTVKKKYRVFYKVNEDSKSVVVEYISKVDQNLLIH